MALTLPGESALPSLLKCLSENTLLNLTMTPCVLPSMLVK